MVEQIISRPDLVEDAYDHHIDLVHVVDVIDALMQAADHVHRGLDRGPGRHGPVCCV